MPFSEKEVFSITPVIAGAGGDRQDFGFGQLLIAAPLHLIGGASFIPAVGAFAGWSVALWPETVGLSLTFNGNCNFNFTAAWIRQHA